MTQWQLFEREVARLNDQAPPRTDYRVLFIGRHGEGLHNAAESYYGTPAWNCYWAEINGNATASWEDAQLTVKGIAQAQKAHDFWQSEIDNQKIPTPGSYYTSPLSRCLATANITFSGLSGLSRPFVPTVKEFLREGISIHTCDHRSNKTYIRNTYPEYRFEHGFKEFDEQWNGVTAEPSNAQDARSQAALNDIFRGRARYISITTHSGEAASILRVLGHQPFSLSTGAVIPVLVEAVRDNCPESETGTPTWTASAHCTTPPLSSISGGACVCPSSAPPGTTTLVNDVSPATTTDYHTVVTATHT